MPEIVGEVYVAVKPDGSEFPQGVQRILDGASERTKSMVNGISEQLSGIARSAGSVGAAINKEITSNLKEAAGAATALYATFKGGEMISKKVAGWFSQIGDSTVSARKGFESLLGESRGEQFLTQIQDYAAASAYSAEAITQMSQGLLGAGLSARKVVPDIAALADVSASVGGRFETALFAFQQMATVGRATGQDMMQLLGAGIPIWKILSESTGKNTQELKKLQEQGKLTFKDIETAINKAGSAEGVKGLASTPITINQAMMALGDTISLLYVRSEGFKQAYETVLGIVNQITAAVGSPRAIALFNEYSDSLNKIFTSLAEAGSGVGINSFQIFLNLAEAATPILSALSATLNAVPTPVLQMVLSIFAANKLVGIARFGAHMAEAVSGLLRFVRSSPAFVSASAANTAAINAEASAMTRLAEAGKRVATRRAVTSAVGGAALLGGSMLQGSDQTNVGRNTGGTALQGAGLGAMLGGPWGAAAGAALGAALGFWQSSEAKAKAHTEKMKELATETVNTYLTTYGAVFSQGYSNVQNAFNAIAAGSEATAAKVKEEAANLAEAEAKRDALQRTRNQIAGRTEATGTLSAADTVRLSEVDRLLDAQEKTVKSIKENLEVSNGELAVYSQQWLEFIGPLEDKFNELRKSAPDVMASLNRGVNELDPNKWLEIADNAEFYGLTLDKILSMTNDEIKAQVDLINQLPGSLYAARAAAVEYQTAFAVAKTEASTIFGPQIEQAQGQLAALNAVKQAQEAARAAALDRTNVERQLQATIAGNQAAQAVYADTLARTGDKAMATAAAFQQVSIQGNYMKIVTQENIDKLIKLSGVADTIENRQLAMNILINGYEEAMAKIQTLYTAITALQSAGKSTPADVQATKQQIEAQERALAALAGAQNGTNPFANLAAQVASISAYGKGLESKGGGGGGGSAGPSPEDELAAGLAELGRKLESAGGSLEKTFQDIINVSQELAESFKREITSRTQYERAVSVGRLTRNAASQAADLGEINQLVAGLLGRGLGEAALESIIGSLGVEDLKQLRRLSRTSDADLAALSAAVGNRDKAAQDLANERTRTAQKELLVEGIVEAGKILGLDVTAEGVSKVEVDISGLDESEAVKKALETLLGLSGSQVVSR